jgi:outer membrane protein TolC
LNYFQRTYTSIYQSGATTYLEVIRAKIEIAKANNELIEAKREAQNSTVGLNLLLGIEPNTTFILTTDLIYTTLKKSLEEILNEYSNKQFSLKISQLFLEQSRMALSLAKKSYLPDFSISLFNQHLAEQPPFDKNNYFGTIDNSWKIEFGISIPVWYWKKQKGEITSAQADFQIAEFNFTKTTRNIHGAIRNAYNIAKSAESQVKIFQETLLSEIEDELKIGITQYQNNQIDALNLIDIYRTYKTIKIEYMKSLYNYQVALADLEVAGEL